MKSIPKPTHSRQSRASDRGGYPSGRGHFYANKFTRLLLKCCVAQEMGPAAALMLAVIAHTEDASHYRRGVRFYDAQIQAIIGVSSWRALNRGRQAAIDAGWLHYEPGSKSRAGIYWTLIPESAKGLDDLPSDEGEPEMHLRSAGESGGENRNGDEMHLRCAGETQVKGQSKSSPDIPIPNPIPPPTRARAFVKPTVADVAAYCHEIRASIDPQAFIDHYESNGWKVGRNPMRDWKAAVRTWKARAPEFAGHGKANNVPFSGIQEFLSRKESP
jgi:hypothetical protein